MQNIYQFSTHVFKKCLAFFAFTICLATIGYTASIDLTNEHEENTEFNLASLEASNELTTSSKKLFARPTVTLTTPSTSVTGPFQVTATYSENVNGFTLAEIQVTNGTKSNPQKISDKLYRWTVNPTISQGTVSILVLANSANNSNGEGNRQSNNLQVTVGDGGGGGDGPDLRLANLRNLSSSANQGAVVNFNFDLINSGDQTASGNYTIGAFLSTDSNFGNGDVKVGVVNTGNTTVGTIPNVQGAITVPANQAPGSYFLILKADDGEVISESNESNNFLSGNIRINDDGGGGGDGPTISLTTPSLNVNGPFQVTATFSENVSGFTLAEIQVNNGTKSNAQKISNSVYRWTVNPSISSGNVTVLVLANSANNSAGEGNQQSNLLSVAIGDGGELADLVISNVNLSQYTANPGDDFGVFVDAASIGAPFDQDLSGGYFLNYFISTDRNLSSNDISIGGTLQRNTGTQIGIGVSLPNSTPEGQYYVIVEGEIRDGSPESNLANNIAVDDRRLTVEGVGEVEDCGFLKTYDVALNGYVPFRSQESSSSFIFRAITNSPISNSLDFRRIIIDKNGTLDNDVSQSIPGGLPSKFANAVLQTERIDDFNFRIKRLGFSGSLIDQRTFTLNPSNPNFRTGIGFANIIELSDRSIIAVSVYTDNTNGRQTPFVIKMDASGNEIFETELPEVDNFTSVIPVALGRNGDVYVRYNLPGRVGQISKVSGSNGSLLWAGPIVGDLVSNRINTPVESADGSALYVPFFLTSIFAHIGKYDANTGAEIYLRNAGEALGSDSKGFNGRNIQALPTSDGGVVIGYNFNSPETRESGYEYGKLDANGNLDYTGRFPDVFNLRPVLQAADGGILFTGSRDGALAIARLSSNGSLEPGCDGGGGGDGIDLELGSIGAINIVPQWSFFAVTFTITNNGIESESGIKVKIPAPAGIAYRGGQEFFASEGSFSPYGNQVWNVGTLNSGSSAELQINYFNTITGPFTIFGQVTAQDGTDVDSTPNNNSGTTPNEDDEAARVFNANAAARSAFGESQNEYSLKNQIRNFKILKTYPSLTANDTRIVLNSKMETNMTVKVYNASGVEVTQQNVHVTEGVNEIQIEASAFQAGMYNVMLYPEKGSTRPLVTRFVKQRL